MGKYFGTDGFRGEAGVTLTADHAYKVGRFLGWYYGMLRQRNGEATTPRIVIGKDTRRSSYMFEYSLVAGLTASGADAYLLHVTTTPSVAYIARVDDFDCGIMISASHNPYYDNGIKLIDCYGEKMDEETLLLVEDYLDGKLHVFDQDWPELPFASRDHVGCTVDYVSGRNRYMGYLISLGIYSFKGVKVGLDCANGSSWNIAKSIFDALGADTYVINNKPNGLNINLNAGSTHIEGLQKFVVENHLDIGFAYDGDADRCLCVDEKGNVITGDHILYIYGCYMKERGKLLMNTVVTTVMSNFGLYKAFDEQGIGYAKTAVGDKYVYEYMAKNGCRIGGEQSGHIIFSKYASTGDGILTSLKMMEVMLAKKKPMSELAAPLKIYPQVLKNVKVTDKKAAQDDADVQAAVKAVGEALGDTGRILVRESGTERLYYCGFSKSEVTYAAAQCEEQGLLKDEFVTDIIDCFEKKNGNIKPLKDKVKELGVTVNVDGMGENSKSLWHKLYFAWSDKLLPEKNQFIASWNGDDTVLNIDGRLVFVYGKNIEESSEQIGKVVPENIIPSIAKYMVQAPNSILDALWLYYFNIFQDALYKRTEFFKNISSDAFFYHANKMLKEEG